MRASTTAVLLVTATACGLPDESPGASAATLAEVDSVTVAFVDFAHAFDYAALRDVATSDFEILIFGRRLNLDGFITLLEGMEASRDGRPLNGYELEARNTEVRGDVAYTSWESRSWLESAVLIREDGRWRVDRAASVRREREP